jgi:two-component system sensor histidine kinase RegB
VVSIGVVAFFLTRMATALRERERQLATAREAVLRNEQILSLGTLAAGAAHQLGTPLATMAVLLRELELSHGGDDALRGDLRLLREQVDRCKRTISRILASAGQARDESLGAVALDGYLRHLLDDWQILRPRVALRVDLKGPRPVPAIAADRTLAQALLNLLDNAADANGSHLETVVFTAEWDAENCRIEILDQGPGLRGEATSRLGEAFFTTKAAGDGQQAGGVGIGLFLSNATIQRFGGTVELFNRAGGGVRTRVTLPLVGLKGH